MRYSEGCGADQATTSAVSFPHMAQCYQPSAAAVISPDAVQDPAVVAGCLQQQVSADSLWGDLGQLNFEALDNWEEPEYVDVEGLVERVVQHSAHEDPSTCLPLLQQLASPETPPYAILGSDHWPQLARMLPHFLASPHTETAAAAHQLLQQQLAPELLHSSPEPLAQLLTALLLAAVTGAGASANALGAELQASQQPAQDTARQAAVVVTAAAAAEGTAAVPGQLTYPTAVLQFITKGLQKLGRQWHFLDESLGAALCVALVSVLLQPLLVALQHHPAHAATASGQHQAQPQPQLQSGQQQAWHMSPPGSLQQQPHEQQPLALQLLLYEPMLSWLHRLHANAASSRQLKAAAARQALPQRLLLWAQQGCVLQQRLHNSSTQQQEGAAGSPADRAMGRPAPGTGMRSGAADSAASTVGRGAVLLCRCVAVHCLAMFVGTPSGRALLQAAGGQHDALPAAVSCLQAWAQQQQELNQQAAQQESPPQQDSDQPLGVVQQKSQQQQQGQGSAQVDGSSMPFPPWGPVRPAALDAAAAAVDAAAAAAADAAAAAGRRTGSPVCAVLSLQEAQSSPAPSAATAGDTSSGGATQRQCPGDGCAAASSASTAGPEEVAVQAAAATAAWALRAFEEQKPWFPQ